MANDTYIAKDTRNSATYKPEKGEKIYRAFRVNAPWYSYSENDTDDAVISGADARRFKPIARNPDVKSALDLREHGVFWSDYGFEGNPDNDYDEYPEFKEIDEKLISEIHKQLRSLNQETFIAFLHGMYRNSVEYGFSVAEIVYSSQLINGNYAVIDIKTKKPYDIDFIVDGAGNLIGFQYNPENKKIIGPFLQKFIIGTYPYVRNSNFYGTPLLDSIYHDVILLEKLENLLAQGSRLLGMKTLIYYEPEDMQEAGDKRSKKILETLNQIDFASVVTLPMVKTDAEKPSERSGHVEVMEDRASAEGLELTQNYIDMLRRRITRVIGIPDDLGFTTTSAGSYAKAKEEMNLFISALVQDQTYLESMINRQLIPAIVNPNFILPENYLLPLMRFQVLEEGYSTDLVNMVAMLIDKDIIQPDEQWIRDFVGIPENTFANDELNKKSSLKKNKVLT